MNSILKIYFDLIKKFLPQVQENTSVGLDIGSQDCKIIEIRKIDDSYELLRWSIEPIKNGDVLASIQKCLGVVSVPSKNPYTAILGKGTLIRYIDMPVMSLEDLKNSFALESDKYFPFPQDQIYTDCCIIESKKQSKNMSVLVAAAKKDIVDKRVELLKDVGLQPDFIGLNPTALVNVLNVIGGDQSDGKAIAYLDMGESVTNLTIVHNKMPRFMRDIYIGGKDITKRISNALGVGFAEAEQLKKQEKCSEEIINAYDLVVMNIVHEIRLSFDYFITEENIEIGKLFLTGGGFLLGGLEELFRSNLEIDVEMWNPVEGLKLSKDIKIDELNKSAPQLGVALGLALYDYD